MDVLSEVKARMNKFYDDQVEDATLYSMIKSCRAYMMGGGVPAEALDTSPLAIDAYVLWARMAENSDPRAMVNHPVIVAIIKQLGGNT